MKSWISRFGILYFALALVPLTWDTVVPLVAQDVLGIPEPAWSGSGDTAWNYVHIAVNATVATAGATVWTLVRPQQRALAPTLALTLRAYLFKALSAYGLMKLFGTQFPTPSLIKLTTTYGESSPMGAAWAYMGASPGYATFTGVAELVGALLLLSRRTTTLGAFVLLGVMANVVPSSSPCSSRTDVSSFLPSPPCSSRSFVPPRHIDSRG